MTLCLFHLVFSWSQSLTDDVILDIDSCFVVIVIIMTFFFILLSSQDSTLAHKKNKTNLNNYNQRTNDEKNKNTQNLAKLLMMTKSHTNNKKLHICGVRENQSRRLLKNPNKPYAYLLCVYCDKYNQIFMFFIPTHALHCSFPRKTKLLFTLECSLLFFSLNRIFFDLTWIVYINFGCNALMLTLCCMGMKTLSIYKSSHQQS